MTRTPGDFLNYGRNAVASGYNSRSYGSTTTISSHDNGDYNGNENSGLSVLQSTESHDGSIDQSERTYSGYYSASTGSSSGEQGTTDYEQGEERGVYSGYNSGADYDNRYDTSNIQIRNNNPEPDQLSGSRRIIKSRKTILDNALDTFRKKSGSRKIPEKTPQKVVSVAKKLLTLQEVSSNRSVLINLVMWTSNHMDDMLIAVSKGHKDIMIWSDLTYEDAELLVDCFQEMGQRSEQWAFAVRTVLELEKKVKVGTILIPRAVKTIWFLFTTGIELQW